MLSSIASTGNASDEGKRSCVKYAATRKIAPPMTTVRRIAFGMIFGVFASSAYMVTASKPMNEKQTIVAPMSTAPSVTPSWRNGCSEATVPWPSPRMSCAKTMTTKTAMTTIENTSSSMLMFEVPRIVR